MRSFMESQFEATYAAHTHTDGCDEWCPALDDGPSDALLDLDNERRKDRSR